MNRYTIRLKDLLCALGTFENDEDYKFLCENDYAVVDITTFDNENYVAMLRIPVEDLMNNES